MESESFMMTIDRDDAATKADILDVFSRYWNEKEKN